MVANHILVDGVNTDNRVVHRGLMQEERLKTVRCESILDEQQEVRRDGVRVYVLDLEREIVQ